MRVAWLLSPGSLLACFLLPAYVIACFLPAYVWIHAHTCLDAFRGRVDARASRPEAFASTRLRTKESMTLTRAW